MQRGCVARKNEYTRDMGKKLFVGSLSWNTTDDVLRSAFDTFGGVDTAEVVTDRDTGRSRGFGFVTFADPADAERACREMDGRQLDGRTITVNEAHERAPRQRNYR